MSANKPQDHQAKKLPVKDVPGGKQVTIDGMKITVKAAALKDHRVIIGFGDLRGDELDNFGKISLNGKLIDRVLGVEQAEMLIQKYADKDGYTDFAVLAQKFNEIIGAAYPNS